MRRAATKKKRPTALDAAAFIIEESNRRGNPVDYEKLQCLLYYSQAWYLAWYGEPLFDDPIYAEESPEKRTSPGDNGARSGRPRRSG